MKNIKIDELTLETSIEISGVALYPAFNDDNIFPVVDPENPVFDTDWGWIGSGPGEHGIDLEVI
ncbi:hypothetical protein M0D21_22740 [Aquimarina sp. D1M17]|uniref:hypothetical protein n=1 Tax=Aquimarina acroporae TaxID=2937283 RepID=UPI0020BF51D0|nr:hypothetical protein [Aquimarina acroporae]MCK8524413.1 hypothetical protein [Aquimarina acroporae]